MSEPSSRSTPPPTRKPARQSNGASTSVAVPTFVHKPLLGVMICAQFSAAPSRTVQ